MAIDAWHPFGPDALGIALAATGDDEGARDALVHATELNPAMDARGRTSPSSAGAWGTPTVSSRPHGAPSRKPVSRTSPSSAPKHSSGSATPTGGYRIPALVTNLTSLAVDWPRRTPVGDGRIDTTGLVAGDLNLLLARRANGERVEPDAYTAARALARPRRCRRRPPGPRAARREAPDSTLTWDVDLVLRRACGAAARQEANLCRAARNADRRPDIPIEIPGVGFDIGSFG